MKKHLIIIAFIIPLFALSQKATKKLAYKSLGLFFVDLNNDGKNDTISISSNTGDKNTFNRVLIKLSGYPKQIFNAKDYWTDFDTLFVKKNKNLVRSNLLFVKKTNKHAVILLSGGEDGAGYSIEFSIVNIENNQVKMVFDDTVNKLNVELPMALTDLNNDERLDFIYSTTVQCVRTLPKGNICSYSPDFVYTVGDTCKLNRPLMKAYNQKYYVFAGYEYSENILIYYPNDGSRPSIWRDSKKQK